MTKEEAIARLQADLGWHHSDGNRKAHEMGIQALERTKWIRAVRDCRKDL